MRVLAFAFFIRMRFVYGRAGCTANEKGCGQNKGEYQPDVYDFF